MISLHIKIDEEKMANAQKALAGVKNGAPKAMSRAINRAAKFGKTRSSKLIRKAYTINAKAVNAATKVEPSTPVTLHGAISFKSRPKQLRNYAVKRTKTGLRASVRRSTGFKRLTKRAFYNVIQSGPAYLRRIDDTRYPIEVLHGPAVPQLADNTDVEPELRRDVQKKLDERLEHEVNALLRGFVR